MYLCPGRAKIRDDIKWYIPCDQKNKAYCEACFKELSNNIDTPVFYFEENCKHTCQSNRGFSSSSVIIDNIRVSVIDINTFYRYKVEEIINKDSVIFGLPDNTSFAIVMENCDRDNTKINIKSVYHNNIQNMVYSELCDDLVINSMSYSEDLVFNKEEDANIEIVLERWRKHDADRSCYILDTSPVNINIKLVCDDYESCIMDKIIDYYKSLEINKRKIIVINDFI